MTKKENQNLTPKEQLRDSTGQVAKPPVVVILGHVDSGKTSLLRAIRQFQFTEEKPGGVITQHIGAFEVEKDGKKITFIDTPGHEAFSAMRLRGAKVADIVILVIDSCAGVQTQTKEAISHIKKAKIPLIVALNKIDRPQADPERAKRELEREGILLESIGGKVPQVLTSAKTSQGIDELLELILLVTEMEKLEADISKPTTGVIIESYLDSKRGPIGTLILEEGILKLGDIIATNSTLGKIKNLEDSQGRGIEKALPGQSAIIIGFEAVPKVGENFKTFLDFEEAKNYLKIEEKKPAEVLEVKPEQKVLNLILKTDVVGSIEAIEEILKTFNQEKILLKILKSEAGSINENDIKLAKSCKPAALILGFRVKTNPIAKNLALREKIKVLNFEVIYDLVEGIRKFMEKILESEIFRTDLGKIKVLVDFLREKNRQIIGGRVIEGRAEKRTLIEILGKERGKNEEIKGKGKMVNLQKNKKDIEKAEKGEEVGILYEGEGKAEVGDILLIYREERKKAEL